VSLGNYTWTIYQQTGGSPSATNDVAVGMGGDFWNGEAFGANILSLNSDAATFTRFKNQYNGRGYGPILASGAIDTVTNQTTFDLNWALAGLVDNTDVDLVGATLVIREGSRACQRTILTDAYQSASRVRVTIDSAAPWTVTTAATYELKDRPFPANFALLGINSSGYIGTVVSLIEEISVVAQVLNAEIVPERVVKLSRRADGTTVGTKVLTIREDETAPIWIDPSAMTGGRNLNNVSACVSSSPAALVVGTYGVNRELAVINLDSNAAVAGTTYTITADIVPQPGQLIKAKISVQVVAD
jgi:hypothetical protein